jgi:pimeloyl-ACP methyl ester carboxylesterase
MTTVIGVPVTHSPEFLATFKHRKTQVNGIDLHHAVAGQGAPVVLIHGFPQAWDMWRKVTPRPVQRYTVSTPDMRGLGDSDRPEGGYDADKPSAVGSEER